MKLLKKVAPIEVKRAFVISDRTKRQKLSSVKKIVLKMSEGQLDKILLRKNRNKRRDKYNKAQWYIGSVGAGEVGVWKKAGGLPLAWTRDSLHQTAKKTALALKEGRRISKERAQTAIPGILKNPLVLKQKEKYLLPIILPGGTMGRGGLRKMKGDIDDGCMRAIALAISGKKKIKAYVGVYTKKK